MPKSEKRDRKEASGGVKTPLKAGRRWEVSLSSGVTFGSGNVDLGSDVQHAAEHQREEINNIDRMSNNHGV